MNSEKTAIIGIRIKDLRVEKKLSQSELGKLLSVSQDTVSLWENSKVLPSADTIILLSKIFDVSSDYLLGIKDY